jgi:hypothetical protein
MHQIRSGLLLALLAGLLAVSSGLPAQAGMAAHRAVYDIALKDSNDRSGVQGVDGRMVIELTGGTCEGWTVTFRMINQYLLQRGVSDDGRQLRFSQRQYIDNRLEEEVLIKVDKVDDEDRLSGKMSKPADEKFKLPAGTIFPVRHQIRLIDAALAGDTLDRSVVFDGSEKSKAYVAVSFIGNQLKNLSQDGKGADELTKLKSWPVSISYFSTDDAAKEETPIYQVRFRMFENGVAGDLVLDYGNFVLDGKLSSYEPLATASCD